MWLRLFLFALMILFALRAAARFMSGLTQGVGEAARRGPRSSAAVPVKMAKDPVCGTFVVPGKALSTTAGGATLWFCSEHCRTEFARRR